MVRAVRLSAAMLAVVMLGACGSSLPTPKTGPHPAGTTSYVEVPFPPPAARVEVIPPKPQEGAVWLDGEWSWQGRRWVWESGGWILPPSGGYFAPWITNRLADGRLMFAPGAWYADKGQPLPPPPILVPAQRSLTEEPSPALDGGRPGSPGSQPADGSANGRPGSPPADGGIPPPTPSSP